MFAIHKKIPQIEQARQAIFVGFFGPVGVSAIFYLYITNEFLETLRGSDGELRDDVAKLPEAVTVVVWFLCITSVVSVLLFLNLGGPGQARSGQANLLNPLSTGNARIEHPLGKAGLLPPTHHLAHCHRRPDHGQFVCAVPHRPARSQPWPPPADVHHLVASQLAGRPPPGAFGLGLAGQLYPAGLADWWHDHQGPRRRGW